MGDRLQAELKTDRFIHKLSLMKEHIMEDQVLKAMKEAGKPVRPGDIAKVLGVDSKEVSKAIAELKKAGKIYSPKRCFYEPVAE